MSTPFFRIVKSAAHDLDKEAALRMSVAALRSNRAHPLLVLADPVDFKLLPESPFAYWVSDAIRRLLSATPSLEPGHGVVRQGTATADDPRFLRLWFEVSPRRVAASREETRQGRPWVAFAKGGRHSPFFCDVALVVNWGDDGAELRNFERAYIRNEHLYFKPGLTYPLRSDALNVRALPSGSAFGHKGPGIFAQDEEELLSLLGILNSAMAEYCDGLRSPRADAWAGGMAKAHEVGAVQILPVPLKHDARLVRMSRELYDLHRNPARFDEVSHDFTAPLLATADRGFAVGWEAIQTLRARSHGRTITLKAALDELVFGQYGVSPPDQAVIRMDVAASGLSSPTARDDGNNEDNGDIDSDESADDEQTKTSSDTLESAAQRLVSYALGCAFGRWDVRIGRTPSRAPPIGGPFDPLPRCSPGMLVGADGLPATAAPAEYPLDVAWDGILVDEKGHPRDLAARVHDVFVALFDASADDRISEVLSILRVADLRTFFRDRFFEGVHRPTYTMGGNPPRRAPIYWPLYPRMGRRRAPYGVWLYYHRLTAESLFTVARLARDRRLAEGDAALKLRAEKGPSLKAAAAREVNDKLEASEGLTTALKDFESEVTRVANLRCIPNFDDGVILNCAVLHGLMAWADAETAWETFEGGKYDWSNIAVKLRPEEATAFRERERRLAEVAAAKSEAKQARAAKAAAKKAASRAAGGRRRRKGG